MPVAVCLLLFVLIFTIKEREEETEKKRGIPAVDSFIILYGSIKREKSGSRGNRRGLANPPKENQKKYKKSIDKSEQVCYNGIIRKAEPSESIKKESGKLGTISKHKERIQNVYKV